MLKTVFFFLLPSVFLAQIVIHDDFSDGNYTANPPWQGDTALFKVNFNNELQLDDSLANSACLAISSTIVSDASWEFNCRLEFNPSSSNYLKVYLVSDKQDLSGSLNGYYVRIGGSASDRVSLYQQSGTTTGLLFETADDYVDLSAVNIGVMVTRDSIGLWTMYLDSTGGNNYSRIDSALENNFPTSVFFGVECTYTTTRSDKFFLDNINIVGDAFTDNKPPRVVDFEVLDSRVLTLLFSEAVQDSSAEDIGNYQILGTIGSPSSATLLSADNQKISLSFANDFSSGATYHLVVSGVEDLFGNASTDTVAFMYYQPRVGDVVINELMIDPVPSIGIPPDALPEREYIELYNQSGLGINLKDWTLQLGSNNEVLPDFELKQDSFVVITKDDGVLEFSSGIPLLGIDMSSVALTNSGNTISLISPDGLLISSVSYTDVWYGNVNKDDGGWALEQIDPTNRCTGSDNWSASVDLTGGTPGLRNSLFGSNPDTTNPVLSRVALAGDSSLFIYFSESIEDSMVLSKQNYKIQPSLEIDSIWYLNSNLSIVALSFNSSINGQLMYSLSLESLPEDCSGNVMLSDSLLFAIPSAPISGDILINEVLFNPKSGGSDFVEIYNNSSKIFDLSKLRLCHVDPVFKTISDVRLLWEESFLLEPGRYLVLTNDVEFLNQTYTVKENDNILEPVETLPAMADSDGNIGLVTADLFTIIDAMSYTDDMHIAVLNDDDGVSLERLSFRKSSSEKDNWQSAAATAGFATPGYVNSQTQMWHSSGKVTISPKVFSPNNDGHNDVVNIVYSFKHANTVVSLSVWTSEGAELIRLQQALSVGQNGFFSWNGVDSRGVLVNSGIYIFVLEYFNETGESGVIKESCVLSR